MTFGELFRRMTVFLAEHPEADSWNVTREWGAEDYRGNIEIITVPEWARRDPGEKYEVHLD